MQEYIVLFDEHGSILNITIHEHETEHQKKKIDVKKLLTLM